MNRKVLIGGIANVLLGDDVEIGDLGTSALDLTHRIAGLHALIFVHCIPSEQHRSGPALSECLLVAEMRAPAPNILH